MQDKLMAELMPPDPRRCNYFFLYDGSKVRGEGDLTREGICYFYPEETLLEKQELLCSQFAGVGRCVSELSSSPVQTLRLRHNKFAIRMKDDFLWALGCSVDVPTVSVCELLDQLINLFCFYNGSVRQSYQLNSQETLAARWARYLSYLQSGSSEMCHIFSCLKTIDSTNVDPLLLLKAALILQACQRCPLVLAGCILFRGRVVSTQMSPELTMKVMVHESETYTKGQRLNGPSTSSSFGGAVSSTTVYLTMSELQYLKSAPVDRDSSSHSTPNKNVPPKKTRLSRTLSDTPSTESEPSYPNSSQTPQKTSFSPHLSGSDNSVCSPTASQSATDSLNLSLLSLRPPLSNGKHCHEAEEEALEESCYHSFHNNGDGSSQIHSEEDSSVFEENSHLNGDGDAAGEAVFDFRGTDSGNEQSHGGGGTDQGRKAEMKDPSHLSGAFDDLEQSPLVDVTLYMHRVKGLVLALLVEPHFLSDAVSMEEVYHSSLASLNGLEAHLRTISPGAPGAPGPYVFAHFDCIQSTLTTNLSGRPGGAPEHPFVRATSLLHSHFCNTETLQEAIIRSAGAAVYGTRSVAQETYFQQHGGSLRNSGIPNHQDSAFSLPSKARHRLMKHGVNLL
ncbi:Hermansky-Pudlak syndrome 4 protein isoform X2 [Acanthochromis polyacanthus]|uniref:Hermansky-Pudlak syndrome 4 protein isoform X2 n=1 Tax=Acanthochromis polyacanthus TaxID=80966 RepID=UPI0022344F60|nr:Hermansky-Pudlak syndrome 4 protein isoform X2 [Acanthochromis polyacanthus]